MLNTTKDFDRIYKCADLLQPPSPSVLREVLNDYATLAAAAKRLVDAVDYFDTSSGVTEVRFNDTAGFKSALAEVEALLKEGE